MAMSSDWANFAKAGNPNESGLACWPEFNPDRCTIMELGTRMGPMPVASSPARLNLWLDHLHKWML